MVIRAGSMPGQDLEMLLCSFRDCLQTAAAGPLRGAKCSPLPAGSAASATGSALAALHTQTQETQDAAGSTRAGPSFPDTR